MSLTAQGSLRGQSPQGIPEQVHNRFLQDFTEGHSPQWRKRGNYYEVAFLLNEYRMVATYSGTGTWMHTEIEIPVEKMPDRAMAHYREQYGSYPLVDTGYHDEEGERYYRIRILRDGVVRMLKYDDNGNFIR
jgi:hypothetical protein